MFDKLNNLFSGITIVWLMPSACAFQSIRPRSLDGLVSDGLYLLVITTMNKIFDRHCCGRCGLSCSHDYSEFQMAVLDLNRNYFSDCLVFRSSALNPMEIGFNVNLLRECKIVTINGVEKLVPKNSPEAMPQQFQQQQMVQPGMHPSTQHQQMYNQQQQMHPSTQQQQQMMMSQQQQQAMYGQQQPTEQMVMVQLPGSPSPVMMTGSQYQSLMMQYQQQMMMMQQQGGGMMMQQQGGMMMMKDDSDTTVAQAHYQVPTAHVIPIDESSSSSLDVK